MTSVAASAAAGATIGISLPWAYKMLDHGSSAGTRRSSFAEIYPLTPMSLVPNWALSVATGNGCVSSQSARAAMLGSTPAFWRRGKPDALQHHSNRGSQYTSEHSSS